MFRYKLKKLPTLDTPKRLAKIFKDRKAEKTWPSIKQISDFYFGL